MSVKELEIVLWRASAIGFGMLLFSFFMMWIFQDWVLVISSYLFPGITNVIVVSGLYHLYSVFKILIFVFFFIPALSLLWHRKARS